MIDPLSLAVGGALYLGGMLTGRMTRRAAAPEPAASVQTCGCGHPLAVHDREAGTCGAEVERPNYWENGTRNGREWVGCPCRSYDGPLPAHEILGAFRMPPRDEP